MFSGSKRSATAVPSGGSVGGGGGGEVSSDNAHVLGSGKPVSDDPMSSRFLREKIGIFYRIRPRSDTQVERLFGTRTGVASVSNKGSPCTVRLAETDSRALAQIRGLRYNDLYSG